MLNRTHIRRARGARIALLGGLLIGTLLVGASMGGCYPPLGSGVTAGESDSGWGGLFDWLPSAAEIEAYEQQWAEFSEQLENLPQVAVRIVNNTAAAVSVMLSSGVEEPEYPLEDEMTFGMDVEPYLYTADEIAVLVAANGTATGELSCGSVIAISVLAPADSGRAVYDGYSYDAGYGLYLTPGNVMMGGLGHPGEDAFSGDTLHTAWYVQPGEDGFDCTNQALVITIESAASQSVFDAETGALVHGTTLGTATVTAESRP
jgi:hypothetical protein